MFKPPPCIQPREPLNHCAKMVYSEKVLGHLELTGEWAGWKLRGKWLISPDGQKINPLRLRGILFREEGEKRVSKATRRENGLTGVVVGLREGLRKTILAELDK